MELSQRHLDWLTLRIIPGAGPRTLLHLRSRFGSPGEILRASQRELAGVPEVSEEVARRIACKDIHKKTSLDKQVFLMTKLGVNLVTIEDDEYPLKLAEIYDPPAILFVKGSLAPEDANTIAIVGTRKCSVGGRLNAETIAHDLAVKGITIASGMAYGIDSAAHEGAMKAGGRTIAVLASGLNVSYPSGNRDIFDAVAESGAVISEFPMAFPAARGHFPYRNRLISGLSLGVVVVEGRTRSGALITASKALEQDREVFAVPGSIRIEHSQAPNKLIKQGAKLVETAEDIIDEISGMIDLPLSGTPGATKKQEGESHEQKTVPADITGEQMVIYNCLKKDEQIHVDSICELTESPPAKVMSTLTMLELNGHITQLPGKFFLRA
ncbi:DNA-processing protein DprA [Candidatus Hydrogenedentota bacterium]